MGKFELNLSNFSFTVASWKLLLISGSRDSTKQREKILGKKTHFFGSTCSLRFRQTSAHAWKIEIIGTEGPTIRFFGEEIHDK